MDVNGEFKCLYLKKSFVGGGGGDQGECERIFEFFLKMQKIIRGGGVWIGGSG